MEARKLRIHIPIPFALCSLLSMGALPATAQIHSPFSSDQHWMQLSEQQYVREVYASSRFSAEQYPGRQAPLYLSGDPVLEIDRARYLARVSSLKLNSPAAAEAARGYLAETVNPAYRQRTSFELARYYFHNSNWPEAIRYYELAGIANLSNEEVADAKFELAYCYFNNLQFGQAEPLFAGIRAVEGRYNLAGNYYYGLLAYNKAAYSDALQSFERIAEHTDYRNVVPYYIAEIYYFKGDRSRALQMARTLIGREDKLYYHNELYLLAAQCLYEERKYKDALPYFEHYYNNTDRVRKEDVYKMGFCYYQERKWNQASSYFKELSNTRDSLGQAAMYLLGDCYLKTGDKTGAKNAFSICADLPYNKAQQEASLLLSGKLAFEAGYSAEGSERMSRLISDFPESEHLKEARTILSGQLLRTGNYNEAYRLLSEVDLFDMSARRLFQRAAYGKAMIAMQQNDMPGAASLLEKALNYREDPTVTAAAQFWSAELAYRRGDYNAVIRYDKEFIESNASAGAVTVLSAPATRQHAFMTMGYAAMKLERYDQAQSWFANSRQSQSSGGYSAKSAADASLREADAAFMQKDYPRALDLYNKTIAANNNDADYARYQKSILLGLQNKDAEQEALLQSIIRQSPDSKYKYEAYYALGELQLEAGKYAAAAEQFKAITEGNARHLALKALMKTGFAYQQADRDEDAIAIYRRVITSYSGSDQVPAALDALKTLYVSANQPTAYVQLLKENRITLPDNNGLDSVFYAAAEAQFSAGKYDKAISSMEEYLKQYPAGMFVNKAHFYKAESHAQRMEYTEALKAYDAVLGSSWSDFTEPASRKAAVIAFAGNDFVAAERYYGLLRNNAIAKEQLQVAYRGLMLSAQKQQKGELAASYADTLLGFAELAEPVRAEARLTKANLALSHKDLVQAASLYDQAAASSNVEVAAEAVYRKASIPLLENKLAEAEAAATRAIQQTTASEYWNVKSYLLIADVFLAQKDYFNAKATLQSIVKNIKDETLKTEALRKLEDVKRLEKGKSKLSDG